MSKGLRGGHVRQNATQGTGTFPVASLTREDRLYLYNFAKRHPGIHFKALSGPLPDIVAAIQDAGINNPYDQQNFDMSKIDPALIAAVSAALAPSDAVGER